MLSKYITVLVFSSLFFVACQSEEKTSNEIPPTHDNALSAVDSLSRARLNDYINRNIDLSQNLYKRALILLKLGDYELALADINKALSLAPNQGQYHYTKGKVLRELNQIKPALESAQRAEALQEKSPGLYVLLADLNQENKQFTEARRYIRVASELAPLSAEGYYAKGALQAQLPDTTFALTYLLKSLDLNPNLLRTYRKIIAFHETYGRTNAAIAMNKRAIARFNNEPDLYLNLAQTYRENLKADSAMLYYKSALKIAPQNPKPYLAIASIYTKWNAYRGAAETYEQLKKNVPSYPNINYLIGLSYEKAGSIDKAMTFYNEELQSNPNFQAAISGVWRIEQRQYQRANSVKIEPETSAPERVLDSTRFKLEPLKPRLSIPSRLDSTKRVIN